MVRQSLFASVFFTSLNACAGSERKSGILVDMQSLAEDMHLLLTTLMVCGGAAMMFLSLAQLQRHFQNPEDVRFSMVAVTFIAGLVLVLFACIPFPGGEN